MFLYVLFVNACSLHFQALYTKKYMFHQTFLICHIEQLVAHLFCACLPFHQTSVLNHLFPANLLLLYPIGLLQLMILLIAFVPCILLHCLLYQQELYFLLLLQFLYFLQLLFSVQLVSFSFN